MTRRKALLGLAAVAAGEGSLDILDLKPPPPDARIAYGDDPNQFGEIRVPQGAGPHPVVIYVHGGYWKAAYSLDHAGHACGALTRAGWVTWNLEYRRIGNPGGGWPGTLEDVERGARFLLQLAVKYRLNPERVVVAGHSAGGHLALWLAAQKPIALERAVSLAGVADLRRGFELNLSQGIIARFLGGTPDEVPERYAKADPMERLPIATPQRLVHGMLDETVPIEMSQRFAQASQNAKFIPVQGAGHFELIDPRTNAWRVVERAILG